MEQEEEKVVMSRRDAAMGWILHTEAAGEAHCGPFRDFSSLLVPKQGLHPTGEQSVGHTHVRSCFLLVLPLPTLRCTSLPISCPRCDALQSPSALLREEQLPFLKKCFAVSP